MTKPKASDLEREAERGASFRLRASDYTKSEFRRIAKATGVGGGRLTIYDAGTLSGPDRKDILKEAPAHVEFEF